MADLFVRSRTPALALAGWTLLTWTTRVPLFLTDGSLGPGEKLVSTVPVLVFVVLALATAATALRRRSGARAWATALAAWSLVYWAVRLPVIAGNDHPAGFVVAHSVLGLVAGTLSVWVVVRRRSPTPWGPQTANG